MNFADYAIIAILLLSVLVGMLRGLVAEVWALICWVCAAWLAWYCGPYLAGYLPQDFATPGVRLIVAYGICFILVLIAGAIVGFLLRRLVSGSGLSGTDRLLGLVFGLARGLALVVLIVLMLGFTPFSRDPWWQQSRLLPSFEAAAAWAKVYLPAELSNYLKSPATNPPESAEPPVRL